MPADTSGIVRGVIPLYELSKYTFALDGEEETEMVCEKLLHKTGEHNFVEKGETFTVRCSIGATYIRNTEFKPADLLTQADMACHKAKSSGRNRFEIDEYSSKTMIGMAREISL